MTEAGLSGTSESQIFFIQSVGGDLLCGDVNAKTDINLSCMHWGRHAPPVSVVVYITLKIPDSFTLKDSLGKEVRYLEIVGRKMYRKSGFRKEDMVYQPFKISGSEEGSVKFKFTRSGSEIRDFEIRFIPDLKRLASSETRVDFYYTGSHNSPVFKHAVMSHFFEERLKGKSVRLKTDGPVDCYKRENCQKEVHENDFKLTPHTAAGDFPLSPVASPDGKFVYWITLKKPWDPENEYEIASPSRVKIPEGLEEKAPDGARHEACTGMNTEDWGQSGGTEHVAIYVDENDTGGGG